jgi:hypothetical protein
LKKNWDLNFDKVNATTRIWPRIFDCVSTSLDIGSSYPHDHSRVHPRTNLLQTPNPTPQRQDPQPSTPPHPEQFPQTLKRARARMPMPTRGLKPSGGGWSSRVALSSGNFHTPAPGPLSHPSHSIFCDPRNGCQQPFKLSPLTPSKESFETWSQNLRTET